MVLRFAPWIVCSAMLVPMAVLGQTPSLIPAAATGSVEVDLQKLRQAPHAALLRDLARHVDTEASRLLESRLGVDLSGSSWLTLIVPADAGALPVAVVWLDQKRSKPQLEAKLHSEWSPRQTAGRPVWENDDQDAAVVLLSGRIVAYSSRASLRWFLKQPCIISWREPGPAPDNIDGNDIQVALRLDCLPEDLMHQAPVLTPLLAAARVRAAVRFGAGGSVSLAVEFPEDGDPEESLAVVRMLVAVTRGQVALSAKKLADQVCVDDLPLEDSLRALAALAGCRLLDERLQRLRIERQGNLLRITSDMEVSPAVLSLAGFAAIQSLGARADRKLAPPADEAPLNRESTRAIPTLPAALQPPVRP